MSETLSQSNHELPNSPEQHEIHRDSPEHHEKHHQKHEAGKAELKEQDELLNEARRELMNEAPTENPIEELKAREEAEKPSEGQRINFELKQITLNRELAQIRHRLTAPDKTLSKVIHQPVVRAVSEATGKTISRPSGLLGGGIVALIGTSSYLYLARHFGFSYNYGVFLVLFVGGFGLGLVIEFLLHATSAKRRANA